MSRLPGFDSPLLLGFDHFEPNETILMKEKTLIEMKNKIDSMTRVLQHLINETTHLRELGVGTLETIKLMPGYEKAIADLKKAMEDNVEQKKKAKQKNLEKFM